MALSSQLRQRDSNSSKQHQICVTTSRMPNIYIKIYFMSCCCWCHRCSGASSCGCHYLYFSSCSFQDMPWQFPLPMLLCKWFHHERNGVGRAHWEYSKLFSCLWYVAKKNIRTIAVTKTAPPSSEWAHSSNTLSLSRFMSKRFCMFNGTVWCVYGLRREQIAPSNARLLESD